MYDAFARDVLDDRTVRKRRIKKVGIWTLQLAAQALFLGLAGNIAWFDDETRVDVNKTYKRGRDQTRARLIPAQPRFCILFWFDLLALAWRAAFLGQYMGLFVGTAAV
jgi:hypothetical protein